MLADLLLRGAIKDIQEYYSSQGIETTHTVIDWCAHFYSAQDGRALGIVNTSRRYIIYRTPEVTA